MMFYVKFILPSNEIMTGPRSRSHLGYAGKILYWTRAIKKYVIARKRSTIPLVLEIETKLTRLIKYMADAKGNHYRDRTALDMWDWFVKRISKK